MNLESNPIDINWPTHYNSDDVAMCETILRWIESREQSQSWLAKRARMSASLVNQVLKGKYGNERGSSPTTHIVKMHQTITHFEETEERVPVVQTSVFKLAQLCCNAVRTDRTMGAFTGIVGTGKTFALKHYVSTHPNTYMLRGRRGLNAPALIKRLISLTGTHIDKGAQLDDKFDALIDALAETDSLLIVDEAENITDMALHYIRTLHDETGVGVVLAGTEDLLGKVMPESSIFHQIGSRITFKPATIRGITRNDADQVALASFKGELDSEVLDAMWTYSAGSIRQLTKAIIPHVKRFAHGKGQELNAELIHKIAKQVLNLAPASGVRRSVQEVR
ncbi:AAA family ATPase [Vibrio sp. YMD68]|uniref:AAA family ATPase n=1 Tax=Vibrio sp. YMD68 TaxID=3042300 RepID=UPI00249AA6CE|nr:AAA family ATPase [Vibrio sp. YMD68]WGV98840.1 AAA family ATPase [Vibrio sp. YMD68]WGW01233.1 AAA family ATPase [Vibrio sp. YMD68]